MNHGTPRPAIPASILERIGDPGRPRTRMPLTEDLGPLPGRSGALAGVGTVAGLIYRGEEHLASLVRRYGPVFRHRFAADPVVMIASPDAAWEILRDRGETWSAGLAWLHMFRDLDARGSLFYDALPHRQIRRLMQPAFGAEAMRRHLDRARALIVPAIESWIRRGEVSFKAEVRRLLATVSARIFMGLTDRRESARLDQAMQDGWQAAHALRRGSALSWSWRRALRGQEALRAILERHDGRGTDLLSQLMQTRDEADWLDDRQVRLGLFVGLMFGAFDTTSSGAASMAYLLARHPTWQHRLRDEAFGLDDARPGIGALRTLEQLRWVWNESLRLFPVAGLLPRVSLRPVTVGGHPIPAGAFTFIMTGAIARSAALYSDPLGFDPERFDPARAEDKRHRAGFLPFGAGPHACIGAQLATAEVALLWHVMLRRCRFRLKHDYRARHQYTPIGQVSGDVRLVLERL